jgi:hypothetical protein
LNPKVSPRPGIEKRYLFSFLGGSTSIIRKKLYKIDYGRADVIIRNTSNYHHWDVTQSGREEKQQEYADILAASYFSLCPRGASAGSLRLYEVMQIGIAPVLISDRFKLPEGPDWDSFLIRIPESQLKEIPTILAGHLSESAERGRLARLAWERWFAPPMVFNNVIEACVRIKARRRIPERWMQFLWKPMLLRHRIYKDTRSVIRDTAVPWLKRTGLYRYDLNRR